MTTLQMYIKQSQYIIVQVNTRDRLVHVAKGISYTHIVTVFHKIQSNTIQTKFRLYFVILISAYSIIHVY